MLKPSACVCVRARLRACIHTANELCVTARIRCRQFLQSMAKPLSFTFPSSLSTSWQKPWPVSETMWEMEKDVMSLSAHCGLSFTRMWSPRKTLLYSDRGTEELKICAGAPLYTHFINHLWWRLARQIVFVFVHVFILVATAVKWRWTNTRYSNHRKKKINSNIFFSESVSVLLWITWELAVNSFHQGSCFGITFIITLKWRKAFCCCFNLSTILMLKMDNVTI